MGRVSFRIIPDRPAETQTDKHLVIYTNKTTAVQTELNRESETSSKLIKKLKKQNLSLTENTTENLHRDGILKVKLKLTV